MVVDPRQQLELGAAVQAEQQAQDLGRLAANVQALAALLVVCGGADEVERMRREVNEKARESDLKQLCLTQPPRPC